MDRFAAASAAAKRALLALGGFVRAMKVSYHGLEVGVDLDGEPGLADSGVLDHDLGDLLCAAGAAAFDLRTALVLFVDELQYVKERQFGALIAALHRAAQHELPVTLLGEPAFPNSSHEPAQPNRMPNACSLSQRLGLSMRTRP